MLAVQFLLRRQHYRAWRGGADTVLRSGRQVVGLRAGVDGGPSGSPPYVRAEMCSAISAVLQRQQESSGGEVDGNARVSTGSEMSCIPRSFPPHAAQQRPDHPCQWCESVVTQLASTLRRPQRRSGQLFSLCGSCSLRGSDIYGGCPCPCAGRSRAAADDLAACAAERALLAGVLWPLDTMVKRRCTHDSLCTHASSGSRQRICPVRIMASLRSCLRAVASTPCPPHPARNHVLAEFLLTRTMPNVRSVCSMGVAAAAELVAALAFSGDRWRAQLLAKGFLQARLALPTALLVEHVVQPCGTALYMSNAPFMAMPPGRLLRRRISLFSMSECSMIALRRGCWRT